MRPSVSVDVSEQFECPACGKRVESPARRGCECGELLRNLSHSRDL